MNYLKAFKNEWFQVIILIGLLLIAIEVKDWWIARNLEDVHLTDEKTEKLDSYEVINVVDGDTIEILIDGKNEKLRLIGIDTPEYGEQDYEEAREYVRELVGNCVYIEGDDTQDERDKYDRLLVYVYGCENRLNVNYEVIKEGYSEVVKFDGEFEYWEEFGVVILN